MIEAILTSVVAAVTVEGIPEPTVVGLPLPLDSIAIMAMIEYAVQLCFYIVWIVVGVAVLIYLRRQLQGH